MKTDKMVLLTKLLSVSLLPWEKNCKIHYSAQQQTWSVSSPRTAVKYQRKKITCTLHQNIAVQNRKRESINARHFIKGLWNSTTLLQNIRLLRDDMYKKLTLILQQALAARKLMNRSALEGVSLCEGERAKSQMEKARCRGKQIEMTASQTSVWSLFHFVLMWQHKTDLFTHTLCRSDWWTLLGIASMKRRREHQSDSA